MTKSSPKFPRGYEFELSFDLKEDASKAHFFINYRNIQDSTFNFFLLNFSFSELLVNE